MKHTMANSLVKYSDEGYPIKSPEDGVKLNDKLFECFILFPFFLNLLQIKILQSESKFE